MATPEPEIPQARATAQASAASAARERLDDLKDGANSFLSGLTSIAQAKPLSQAEVKQIREDLIAAYQVYATQADWAISQTNRRKAEAQIWSTIQDDEYATLADFALEMGRANPVIAQSVRGMVRTARGVKVGAILGPRAWATLQHYAQNGGFGI